MIFLRPLFVYYYLLPVFFFIIFLTICPPFFFFSPVLSSWWFLSFGPGRSGVLTDRRTNVSHLYHTLLSPFNRNNDLYIFFTLPFCFTIPSIINTVCLCRCGSLSFSLCSVHRPRMFNIYISL